MATAVSIAKMQQGLLDEIIELNAKSRLLAAVKKYETLKLSLKEHSNSEVSLQIIGHATVIDEMIKREKEACEVLAMESVDESWISGSVMFGTTTHYKLVDGGSIMIRLEGELDNLPMFEQLAVIHEVDLFHEWIPFCNTSRTITKVGPVELIVYFGIFLPPITRDVLLRAYGVNCLFEEAKILLIGSSIDEWPVETKNSDPSTETADSESNACPANDNYNKKSSFKSSEKGVPDLKNTPWRKPKGWFHDRMIIRDFVSVVHILSPNVAKTVVVARVDPRLPLPQGVINFVIKNLAGVFLTLFQRQVIKVVANRNSSHGQKIRENRAFYEDWLLPSLCAYCDFKNWPWPTISSLGIKHPDTFTTKEMQTAVTDKLPQVS